VSEEVTAEACPLVEVIDHEAGKRSISILVAAARGPIRFERDGLPARTVHPTVPRKAEYSLTAMA
jgi:DNA-binding HxlR family transcriptional regulator